DMVIEKSKAFLDQSTPLMSASHKSVTKYTIQNNELIVITENGEKTGLKDASQFVGFQGEPSTPTSILLKNNDLHIDIQIDASHPIGKTDAALVKDVVVESAITSIMDCEDSVAAVDAEDKVDVYRNWKGLIRGELSTSFQKGNETVHRTFNE